MLVPVEYSYAKTLFRKGHTIIIKPDIITVSDKGHLVLKRGVTVTEWDDDVIERYRASFGMTTALDFFFKPDDVMVVWNGNGYLVKDLSKGRILNLSTRLKERGICKFVNSRLLNVVNKDSLQPSVRTKLAV